MTTRHRIERICVSSYEVPTDHPEQDGTLSWDRTVLVVAEAVSSGVTGIGYTYASEAAATLIERVLARVVIGSDAFAPTAAFERLEIACRNLGTEGVGAMAISALDVALWDLKARLLELPLAVLLGAVRTQVPVYGSGGFTSYDRGTLQRQLAGWVGRGIHAVKMKVGAHPETDAERVRAAREAIGSAAELFVDANGAYTAKQALHHAELFAQLGVSWLEEPVSSDDLPALRFVRERAPIPLDIAAGEYGYRPFYFLRMLEARAADVLQLDATRCGGVSGFLRAVHLAGAFNVPLSCHCAPALHLQLAAACSTVRHIEYFHDHARIESNLLGASEPVAGNLELDVSRAGLGLKSSSEAKQYLKGRAEIRA